MCLKVMLTISVLTGGGAERVVSVWANKLAEKGYDVSLLIAGRTDNEYSISDKVKVHTIAPTYGEYQKLSQIEKIIGRRRILKKVRPDYLISFLPYIQVLSLFTSIGLGIKRIETVRISPWHAGMNHGLGKYLWRLCFATSNKVILQSLDQADYFNEKIRKKCIVVPNPISDTYINKFKNTFSKDVKRFIAAGRICAQKNYSLMIDGFAKALKENEKDMRYKGLHLDIYGAEDGEDVEVLKSQIKRLGLESTISFCGRTSELDVKLRNSDVFLMTSDYEGMPNSLLEAMSVQLLCIATNCKTGPRELIENKKNGFLIPVGDVEQLSRAICEAVEMPYEERIMMGTEARKKILTLCSEDNSVNKLEAVLK